MFVEVVHMYRRLTEKRDIDSGQMSFYYFLGWGKYVFPVLILSLRVEKNVVQMSFYYFLGWGKYVFPVLILSLRVEKNVVQMSFYYFLGWASIILLVSYFAPGKKRT